MTLLEEEDPPRVTVAWDVIDTGKGRQRSKVWRPAGESSRVFAGYSQGVLEPPRGNEEGYSEGKGV
jgi:hypothetical protein